MVRCEVLGGVVRTDSLFLDTQSDHLIVFKLSLNPTPNTSIDILSKHTHDFVFLFDRIYVFMFCKYKRLCVGSVHVD